MTIGSVSVIKLFLQEMLPIIIGENLSMNFLSSSWSVSPISFCNSLRRKWYNQYGFDSLSFYIIFIAPNMSSSVNL